MSQYPPLALLSDLRRAVPILDLPEILQCIFRFLDDYTLRHAAILVCRSWYHAVLNSLPRTVVWHNSWDRTKANMVSSRLVGASRLFCYLGTDPPLGINSVDIRRIISQSQITYYQQTKARKSQMGGDSRQRAPTLYRFGPLQELYLEVDRTSSSTTINDFPFPYTLTRLVLNILLATINVATGDLSIILRGCPLLKTFEAHGSMDVSLTWTLPETDRHQQQPLALQSFIIYNIAFKQDFLESLLALATRLKVLKLISMPSEVNIEYDWPRLIHYLRSLPIVLDTIHISSSWQPTISQILEDIEYICSSTRFEWTLWTHDVSPSLLKNMELNTNNLTTLEIHSQPQWSRRSRTTCCQTDLQHAPAILHTFFTTCDSDKLVNLRTLKTFARLEDFDINHRGRYYQLHNLENVEYASDVRVPTTPAALWRCRGLRTLHLEMHGSGELRLQEPIHSRIIFGYISRVFPLLEELEIGVPGQCFSTVKNIRYTPKICLSLDGGLCLLGRLRYLQRLKILLDRRPLPSSLHGEEELNWMVPSGRTKTFRALRQRRVQFWQQQRFREDRLERHRHSQQLQQHMQQQEGIVSTNATEALLLSQLQSLGLLRELEEVVWEIGLGLLQPLPCLEGLSISNPYFGRAEDEIKHFITPRQRQ